MDGSVVLCVDDKDLQVWRNNERMTSKAKEYIEVEAVVLGSLRYCYVVDEIGSKSRSLEKTWNHLTEVLLSFHFNYS